MNQEDKLRAVVAGAIRSCTSLSSRKTRGATGDNDDALLSCGFEELEFDSLAFMEFCIAIHLETGIDIDVSQVEALGSPVNVVEFLNNRR